MLMLLLSCVITVDAQAQNIDNTCSPCNTPTCNFDFQFPDQVSGDAAPATIITGTPGSPPITITALSFFPLGNPGPQFDVPASVLNSSPTLYGLTLNTSSPNQISFDGEYDFSVPPTYPPLPNPGINAKDLTINFTLQAGSGCTRNYTIHITRKPIDLMLVLDKSGSMNSVVTGGTDTRWEALKSGVDEFLSNYQPLLLATGGATGDQMGIRMFSSTDAAPVNAPFNVPNFIPVTPTSILASILDGDSPGGSTAMGSGLITAVDFLFPGGADNGHKKSILLFTDGQQNVAPDVVAAPGSNPTVSGTDITHGDQIQIHTIGLGVPGAATQTLYNIAHESGVAPNIGISNIANNSSTTPPDLNLSSYLTGISNQLLSGSTPQYVDIRRDNFKLAGERFVADDSFTVSKNIAKIFINFICAVTNEARVIRIEKDGQTMNLSDTSYVISKRGRGWETFIISVAGIKKQIPTFTSDGNWKVTAFTGSQSAAPYILSLTVDDHNSEMRGRTTQTKELLVGDNLPLSIDFTKSGAPITNANAIALIAKPGEDLGDLLARTNVDIKIDTNPDADNPGSQKLQELLKDSAFLQKLLDSNHAVNLTYDPGQKKYVGEFTELDVSGVYQVAYIVSATDTSLGEIKRYAEESVYIRFPDIDLDKSAVTLVTTQNGISTLTFRPIANNGKFIGPGWGNAIKIDGTNTKITNVVDHLDGSYTLTVEGSLTDNVTLSIGTAEVYKGKLENIGKDSTGTDIWKQWWFWLIVIVIILLIWFLLRKKNP